MAQGTLSLFEESYWLDCVAPGGWDAIEVWDGATLVGRLPHFFKKRGPLSYLTNPPFTPWLSPWVSDSGGKYTNELSHQHAVLAELIRRLPKASAVQISCAPEFTNLLPFYWSEFQLGVRYTYRLEDLGDLDGIWSNMRENVRRQCRKAERNIETTDEGDFSLFKRKMERFYDPRRNQVAPVLAALERIEDVMANRGQRRIYLATDDSGQAHAGAYVVFDRRSSFYISGWSDPSVRKSGAHSADAFRLSYPIKLFEYMAAGLPVIASSLCGGESSMTQAAAC